VVAQAQMVDAASARVDQAVEGLGLTHCSDIAVKPVGVD
jgi:hypothetical protein